MTSISIRNATWSAAALRRTRRLVRMMFSVSLAVVVASCVGATTSSTVVTTIVSPTTTTEAASSATSTIVSPTTTTATGSFLVEIEHTNLGSPLLDRVAPVRGVQTFNVERGSNVHIMVTGVRDIVYWSTNGECRLSCVSPSASLGYVHVPSDMVFRADEPGIFYLKQLDHGTVLAKIVVSP